MRLSRVVLLLLLVGSLSAGGCAPLVVTGAAPFIAAGAGAGYVATHEKPRSKVEQFFDDLSRSIRQTTRRITGDNRRVRRTESGRAPATAPVAAAEPKSGFSLKIVQSSLAPARVKPGDQVKLTLQYRVAGAPGQGVGVREKSSLAREGKELTVLKEETTARENGTWENTLTFAVPASAQPGKYTVTLQVSAQGQARNARRAFAVQ